MSIDKLNQTVQENFLEKVTGGLSNINTDHGAIHKGYLYYTNLEIASLASTATSYFLLEAPTNLYMHIKGATLSALGSSVKLRVFRNINEITAKGTEQTNISKNTNDNSSSTSDAKFYSGPTTTGGLTDKWFEAIAYGSTLAGNNTVGNINSLGNPNIEWVSANGNKQYLLEIENIGSETATDIELNFFHYEELTGLVE